MANRAGGIVSSRLLKNLKYPPSPATKRRIKANFNLGMGDWEPVWSSSDDDDFQLGEPARKKHTSSEPVKRKRFAEPTTSGELEKCGEGVIPKNTQKNDEWSLRTFNEWIKERNTQCDEKCPENILQTEDAEILAKWLSLFTIEVRKKDGSRYPPATIHMLLCGLQRTMRRCNKQPFDIFAKKDVRFRHFHGTMESVFQKLHEDGVGAEIKHTEVISEEEEAVLWDKGILGNGSPRALLRAVFFLNGKNFCLRGGQEHRRLKLSQLQRGDDHWKYVENGSKNFRGGIADLRRENKVVYQYSGTSRSTCHVRLLDMYIEKLPCEAKRKDCFYFTPLKKTPDDPEKPWFSAVPVGWNKLDSMVKEMFAEVGIEGKTNHSLRATGTTRMYKHGIQEKTIQSRTGHKSLEALRVYERPGIEQHREACEALANITNTGRQLIQPPKPQLHGALTTVYPCTGPPSVSAQPPTFNFSGCSVNVFTGPVMTSGTFTASSNSLTKKDVEDFDKF